MMSLSFLVSIKQAVFAGLEILSHTTGFYNASFDYFESDCFEIKRSFAVLEALKKITCQYESCEALRNPMLYGHRVSVKNKA